MLRRQWQQNIRNFHEIHHDDADVPITVHEYHSTQLATRYGFCTDDYRPECWWYEPVDMMRKLSLSGLLQFAERGTATQVLLGCCLAFFSFGLQIRLLPYRQLEANILKTTADLVLFLTFLISFILRVIPRVGAYEPVTDIQFGWFLVACYVCFVVVGIGLTMKQTLARRRFGFNLSQFVSTTFESGIGTELLTQTMNPNAP
jgi:hypothetical protein